MKIFDRLREFRRRLAGVRDPQNWQRWPFPNRSGVFVNEDIANTYSAMWAAKRVISQSVACLSWDVHRILPRGGTQVVPDDRVQHIVNRQVNPEMTSLTFREAIIGHALFWGNGYAEIERDIAGRARHLWLLPPDCVEPKRDLAGNIVYELTGRQGQKSIIPMMDMYHLKGLGFDGLVGHSMISMARRTVATALATEMYTETFFGNDSRPGGVLKHPGKLKDTARENIKREWEEVHKGPENKWKVALLEEGLAWESIGIPPEDAQMIESRKFQVAEVSRWTGLPPSMLGDWENAHFNNVEQQRILVVADAIKPWAARADAEGTWKLIGRNRQATHKTVLNVDSLAMADMETKFKAIATGRQWGLLTADEGRQMLGFNPLPSKQNGSQTILPENMFAAEQLFDEEPEPPPPKLPGPTEPEGDDEESPGEVGEEDDAEDLSQLIGLNPIRNVEVRRLSTAYFPVIDDIMRRSVGREVSRLGKPSPDVEKIYDEHHGYMVKALNPAVLAFTDMVGPDVASFTIDMIGRAVEDFCQEYCSSRAKDANKAYRSGTLEEVSVGFQDSRVDWTSLIMRRLTDLLLESSS